jgi:pyruvate,water dikinase
MDKIKHIGEPVLTPETEDWGGKATNLLMLSRFTNVPPGFIVNADGYDEFVQQSEIQGLEWIDDEGDVDLNWIQKNQGREEIELSEIQETTQDVFLNNELPSNYEPVIEDALMGYGPEFFTRSSAVNEDGDDSSGAGRLESFGPLEPENVLEGVKRVYASPFDEKAINYLQENNLDSFGGVAVVVQEAIDPEFGGVMYTSDPNGDPNDVYIEVNETPWQVVDDDVRGIVHVDSDDIPSGRSEGGSFRYKANKGDGEPLMSDSDTMMVAGTGIDIQEMYDSPMDVEFAKDSETGEIYMLQGRSITVDGYDQPEFDIPGDIRDIAQDDVLAQTGIVRNSGILDAPAVVVDDADTASYFEVEGELEEHNDRYDQGYVLATPVMNEDIENRTGNAVGLVASDGGKTSHASTVADENGLLYMGALESEPQDYLEHGDPLYMAVNGHEGILARGETR